MIAPGRWLGVLGGGQLGRMFCFAAQAMGYRVAVLDPDPHSPAGATADRHLCADYLDAHALRELATLCDAITTEFENVPSQALATLAHTRVVAPSASAVAIAQNRIAEKRFIESCGIAVAPHAVIEHERDLDAIDERVLPGILKVSRLGYDGKGQARVVTLDEARHAFRAFGSVACVLERRLALDFEISVVCVRGADGTQVAYPIVENVHRDGILAVSTMPSPRAVDAQATQARDAALKIAARLEYVGVLCVEFFVLADGSLVANEMAPRPHNSGHATIDACTVSQFEQQVRALTGLPLGATDQHSVAVMFNVLGDLWFDTSGAIREPAWSSVLATAGAALHLYGKAEARHGRKMGHITCVASTLAEARRIAESVARGVALDLPRDPRH